jgi:DNA-binding Xre family transcriptional regulator
VTWTREAIVAAIHSRHNLGQPVDRWSVHRDEPELFAASKRILGTWEAVMKAAGLKVPLRGLGRALGLRALRVASGLTQAELGARIGKTAGCIGCLENHSVWITPKNLEAIARVLECEPAAILKP